ncbi:MAG: site-specific DNA-methyltransferase [Rhodoferax sp.]|nr:site-specific DNA-methyltransferase [Rhodoferax sp.]
MQKIEANSPEAQSADLVRANIEQLKKLFPELLTESANGVAVNVDVLKALVGDKTATDADEKYGLNWHGKRRARQLALTPSTGTLRPCPDESVDWDTTQNLMIEGDNLEVLKLLQKSYAGKVKLIYIDPPYNTGKDFVYPDNFQDNIKNYLELTGQTEGGARISSNTDASGRFHTDWLNMVYPRLKLARNLLREDGLIFISLDDSEIASTRKICDEFFGEENFVDCMVWKKRYGGGAKEKYLVTLHEYILVYAKSLDKIQEIEVPLSDASVERYYTTRDQYFEEKGPYRTHPLEAMKSFEDRLNLRFPIPTPDGGELFPKRQWRWGRERMQEALDRGEVAFSKTRDGSWIASSKQYLKDDTGDTRSAKAFSIIDGIYTQAGTAETVEMFGDARVFSFPKPTALIQRIVEIATSNDKDALIIDFFAGSGTTGQAVVQQNIVDGGNRRFILVQLPEPLDTDSREQETAANYCDQLGKPRTIAELTKERLRRSASKIRATHASQTSTTGQLALENSSQPPATLPDLGFRVFKLDHSNIRAWNPKPADLAQAVIDYQDNLTAGRTESDILYELLLKLGLDLCVPIATRQLAGLAVHAVGGGVLMACLAPAIASTAVDALATGIIAWRKELAPAGDTTCVFRDSAFADDIAKTNLSAILAQQGIQNVRSL